MTPTSRTGPTLDRLIERAARRHPAREWVVCGEEQPTYRTLAERVERLGSALDRRGIGSGERVAVLSTNCHRALELLYGIPATGRVAVPLNFRFTAGEIEYILRDSGARLLFAAPDLLPIVRALPPRLPDLGGVIALGRGGEAGQKEDTKPESSEDLFAEGESGRAGGGGVGEGPAGGAAGGVSAGGAFDARGEEKTAFLIYTSGTTGFPKGAILSHRNVIDAAHWGICQSAFPGIGPEDRVLVPVPLYHVAGTATALSALVAGATVVLMARPDVSELFALVERERVTRMTVVPFLVQAMVDSPDVERRDLSSVRSILYAGAPTPVPLLERALDRFGGRLVQAYGLTETGPSGTVLTAEEHRRARESGDLRPLGSVGREMLHCDVRVFDEKGCELECGEVGEVAIRSSSVMLGYWRNEQATAESFRGDWFLTGDVGRFDEDGYLYLVDRKKDMIVSGGENVYPREVETVLHEHPAIADCAVVGLPDQRWGERVTAVVVASTPIEPDDLIAHCRGRLAGFKCPKEVRFVEALPRNPSGKILKKDLRETLLGRSSVRR